jgi:Arc/MetJ family transcription regulator
MRTTLNIDDEALEQAMKAASGKTKTQIINEALREFARRRKIRGLLEFKGKAEWAGNIDKLRKRRPTTR